MLSIHRRAAVALVSLALISVGAGSSAPPARASGYVPGEVLVGYTARPSATVTADLASRLGIRATAAQAPDPASASQVVRLPRGLSVVRAIARLRHQRGIAYAVPDFIAHAAGSWIPDDRGRGHTPGGWQRLQWNFLAGAGVNAPEAWANLRADRRPGGRGVVVAVLDTGVAYRDWHQYRASTDFGGTRFVDPYDFVAGNRFPLDREGHGTFVTNMIAEATNNGVGLTGLAYGASIMPVRILAADGTGDAETISRGIRYAVTHGAKVINLSLEFSLDVTAGDIPEIISAIRFAHNRGAVTVAAAGNEGVQQIAYPARAPAVISVGASTRDRCLADYSNTGSRLDLVAPGGGDDIAMPADPDCHPTRNLPDISQLSLLDPSHPSRFGYPGGWYGTSMAAPHVAAAAALVIASGTLGRDPTPDQVLARLEATAQPLGGSAPNKNYGYGLLDAGAATAPIAATAGRHG